MIVHICNANSLVGAITNPCVYDTLASIFCSIPIANVAVFPVPDWACPIVSLNFSIGNIPFSWIADGFTYPIDYTPRNNSSFKFNSEKSLMVSE